MGAPAAVVFDLDGVLIDSEQVWDAAREDLVRERGGTWDERATTDMMGMSSKEWSSYMHDRLGVPMTPAEINDDVVRRVASTYEHGLPLLPHALETVRELAARWPLGLASSSNRPIIDLVLEQAGVRACFAAVVSSEEVANGKPAPGFNRNWAAPVSTTIPSAASTISTRGVCKAALPQSSFS